MPNRKYRRYFKFNERIFRTQYNERKINMNKKIKKLMINNSLTNMITHNLKTKVADVVIDHLMEKATKLILREITVSLSFRKFSDGIDVYNGFLSWLSKNNANNSSLETVLDYHGSNRHEVYDLGNKPVYFKFEKHHFIAYKKEGQAFDTIIVTMLGRDVNVMKRFYQECRKCIDYGNICVEDSEDREYIQVYSSGKRGNWDYMGSIPARNIDTVIIDDNIKTDIFSKIEDWKASENWFKDRGIPYKLSLLLYGPPGTGKTSLIKAIASTINYNIYMLDISSHNDQSLLTSIRNIEPNSIIVFEDFDAVNITKSRNENLKAKNKFIGNKIKRRYEDCYDEDDDYDYKEDDAKDTKVTFNGLLNILDGVVPMDNKIIIFTTNVIEKLDAAMLRHGRVDFKYYIGEMGNKEIRQYIKMMFPEAKIPNYDFKPILGCDIQALFFDNKYDSNKFIDSIPRN